MTLLDSENLCVDIVIPLYNAAEFIGATIESVQAQSHQNWKLWVVDDLSTDSGREIVKSYALKDDRIRLIELSENFGGPALPRNRGIQSGKSEFVAFLDSDDLWVPEKLTLQLNIMKKMNSIDFVCSNFIFFPRTDIKGIWLFKDRIIRYQKLLKAPFGLKAQTNVVNSSVLIRRSVFERVGFLDENPFLIASEDYDFWLRVLAAKDNSGYLMKEALVKYRIHQKNITGTSKRQAEIFERLDCILKKHPHPDVIKLRNSIPKKSYLNHLKLELYTKPLNIRDFLKIKVSIGSKLYLLICLLARRMSGY